MKENTILVSNMLNRFLWIVILLGYLIHSSESVVSLNYLIFSTHTKALNNDREQLDY